MAICYYRKSCDRNFNLVEFGSEGTKQGNNAEAVVAGFCQDSAVTRELKLNDLDLLSICQPQSAFDFERQLFQLLEILDMQELVVSTSNLSSIRRDVGNQTVALEITEVYDYYAWLHRCIGFEHCFPEVLYIHF